MLHHRDPNYTNQLPDELLDIIIRQSGPLYSTAAADHGFPDKKNWLACGSVCRRWRRVALSHIFRYVRVLPSDRFADTSEDRAASKFGSFLLENPSIAPLIEQANLACVIIESKVLRSILTALTNLQYLVLHHSFIEGSLDLQEPPLACKVSKLLYIRGACELYSYPASACKQQIPLLLRLFSEIGEFEDLHGCDHVVDEPLAGCEAPRIYSCSIGVPPHTLARYSALYRLHVFDHLSCLRLSVALPLEITEVSVNDFLQIVGGSLHELSLKFDYLTSRPVDQDSTSAQRMWFNHLSST